MLLYVIELKCIVIVLFESYISFSLKGEYFLFHGLAPLYEILSSSLGAWYEKYEMFRIIIDFCKI